ncbi:MAG: hypothetical protein N3A53_01920, partial [Verrucomicrobiae bacterium]|nr:hypothetical protein [Verrucomicrobiae bacterium]
AQMIALQAQQARLDGKAERADELSRRRLGILSKLGFLGEAERDPLAIATRQLETAQKQLDELKRGLTIRTVK